MKRWLLAGVSIGVTGLFSAQPIRDRGADEHDTQLGHAWLTELLDRNTTQALALYDSLASAAPRSDTRWLALARSAEIHRVRGENSQMTDALRDLDWRGRRANLDALDLPRAALATALAMPAGAQRTRALADAREGLRTQVESALGEGSLGPRPLTTTMRWRPNSSDPVDTLDRMRAKWRTLCIRLATDGETESADRLRQRLGAQATTRDLREVREDPLLTPAERDALGEFIARVEVWRAEGRTDLAERARAALPY